ncbi:MAG TPA: GAF domain-containing protein [Nitrospira sp.]|nr:GAF domain-containing protein [Nitrospira sp.]
MSSNASSRLAENTNDHRGRGISGDLCRSEQDIRDFIENASIGMHSVGPDGIIVWANRTELDMLGYAQDEYIGHHIADFHADPSVIEDILRRLAAHETLRDYEARLRCKDGSIRHVVINSNVLWDGDTFVHTRCFTRDITERKQTEQERVRLLAREWAAREEAETLHDVAKTLAAELDLDRLLQKVTDAGTSLTGAAFGAFFYNQVNEQGESYFLYTLSGAPREAFAKFDLPRNTPLFEPTFRGTGVVRIDDVLQDPRYGHNPPHHGMPKGHLPVRSYLAVPVVSRSGEVLGGLFFGHPEPAMFTDRAERFSTGIAAQAAIAIDNARLFTAAQAEIAQRKQAEASLREGERRFREMIDALPVAIYTTDAEGRLTHFNPAAAEFSGQRPELGTDKWCVTWKLYRPDGTPMSHDTCPMAVALKEGRVVRGAEAIAERPDGTRIWFTPYPTPLRDSSGTIVGGINMLVDITERKQAEMRIAADRDAMALLHQAGAECSRPGSHVDACLSQIVRTAIAMTGASKGNLQLFDPSSGALRIAAQQGFEEPFLTFFATVDDRASACGTAMERCERIIVEDVTQSEIFAGTPALAVMLEAGARAVQSTPLISSAGNMLGMISTHFSEPHRSSERELRLMDLLARQAADYLERQQAEEALRQSQAQLAEELADTQLLQCISAEIVHEDNIQRLYDRIVGAAAKIMRSDYASMQMLYPDRGSAGELRLLASCGFSSDAVRFWEWVGADSQCTCGMALRTRDRAIVPNVEQCGLMAGTEDQRAYLQAGILAAQSTPLISREGKLLGMISTHWRQSHEPAERRLRLFDILARQATELIERAQAAGALRRSEARFRELVERSPFGTYIVDAEFRIAHMNESGQRGAFRNVKPVIGRDFAEAMCILWPEPVAAEIVRVFRHTLNTGESYFSKDFINPRADVDKTEGYEWELHRLMLQDGQYGVICYYFDSTKLRETEAVLRTAQERLKQWTVDLERAVTEKTAELLSSREKLRALAAELNLAEQRERKRLATEMHDHLQQLLVLGKMQVGQGKRYAVGVPGCEAIMKKVDETLSEALAYTRTLVSELSPPALRDHGIAAGLKWLGESMRAKHDFAVTVTVSDNPGFLLPEDQTVLLFQSVRELLINSWKHAGTGEAAVSLEYVEYGDGLLRITVTDNGTGFDLAAAAAAAADTLNGGLSSKFGLFSIRERMRALDGSFDIQSAPGQGTTATLTLPLQANDDQRYKNASPPKRTSSSFSPNPTLVSRTSLPPRIRLLLVDDHTMVRKGLRSVLEGYADLEVVGEAANGEEAMDQVVKHEPAIVLMDISMPKMNGIEGTARIKERRPDIQIIGLSVNADEVNHSAMLKAGAVTLLTKEAAVEQLYGAIQDVMKHSNFRIPG